MAGDAKSARVPGRGSPGKAELTQNLDAGCVAAAAGEVAVLDDGGDPHRSIAVRSVRWQRSRRQAHGEHALGAALAHDPLRVGPHDRGVDPAALTGDQLGMRHHGVADAGQGRSQRWIGDRGRIGEASEGKRQPAQRHPEADDAAAIGRGRDALDRNVGERRDRLERQALDGVVGMPVAVDRPTGRLGEEDHGGVLARAVPAQRGRLLAVADQPLRGLRVERRVHLVLKDAARQSGATQDLLDEADVAVLTAVAGGHDCQRLGAQLVLVEATRRDERRELEGLCARSKVDELVRITGRGDRRAIGRDDGDRAAMDRFDLVAAGDLDEDRRCGGAGSTARATWHPRCESGRRRDGRATARRHHPVRPAALRAARRQPSPPRARPC